MELIRLFFLSYNTKYLFITNKLYENYNETLVCSKKDIEKYKANFNFIQKFNSKFGDNFSKKLLDHNLELYSKSDLIKEYHNFRKHTLYYYFYKREVIIIQ